jgi:hypothetical protein
MDINGLQHNPKRPLLRLYNNPPYNNRLWLNPTLLHPVLIPHHFL